MIIAATATSRARVDGLHAIRGLGIRCGRINANYANGGTTDPQTQQHLASMS